MKAGQVRWLVLLGAMQECVCGGGGGGFTSPTPSLGFFIMRYASAPGTLGADTLIFHCSCAHGLILARPCAPKTGRHCPDETANNRQ